MSALLSGNTPQIMLPRQPFSHYKQTLGWPSFSSPEQDNEEDQDGGCLELVKRSVSKKKCQRRRGANNKDKGKKLATKGCKEAGAKARSKMQLNDKSTDGGPSKNKKKQSMASMREENRRDEVLK